MNYRDEASEAWAKNRDRADMSKGRGMARNRRAMNEGLAEIPDMEREAPMNEGGGDQN